MDSDDPRLTAYALGELPDPADRAHVEALLAASPEACAELADIRALTAALTAEYEQDRLMADTAASSPNNIIRLVARVPDRWAWARPLLAAVAVLLLAGILGLLVIPVYHKAEMASSRPSAVFSVSGNLSSPNSAKPAAVVAVQTPETQSASATSALLAAAAPSAAAPVSLAMQSPPIADGQITSLKSKNVFYGANGVGGALLADASKKSASPEMVAADPVVATGSNIPTDEEVAPAPAKAMLAQSEAMAPRRLLRASSQPPGASAKPAAAFPMQDKGDILDQRYSGLAAKDAEADGSSLTTATRATALPDDGSVVDRLGQKEAPADRSRSFNTAAYDHVTETPFLTARENPLSTFSVDVDTASYSIVRRFIEHGSLPPAGAVRIEEMLNYFPYDYAPPAPGDEHPFAVHLEGAACPWNPDHRLVRVALKGREIAQDKRPPSNLVFLLDVSGSMEPPERLPLIKESLRLLVEKLTENDRVAIVVYAGNSGLVLPSTNGTHKDTILQSLDRLEAGGSTNGASGIRLAYKVAQENFLPGGTNRVILATDGDFNVGTTSQGELVRLIEKEAKGGVFLTCLGVGTDNLKDSTMQKLADHGNGNYAYLDGIAEGRKVLVEQMSGTLVTIAKDVKIQVEFNPAAVNSYRLIGYEKRMLRKEDFNDDRVDAGEIGAGHSVTALYEVVPTGQTSDGAAPAVDALKYQTPPTVDGPVRAAVAPPVAEDGPVRRVDAAHELLTVKIRHKAPDSDTSERSYEVPFTDHGTTNDYANATPDFKFAAAVATFGMVLRDSSYKGNATLGAAIELAQDGKGADPSGYRAGFIELARRAAAIQKMR